MTSRTCVIGGNGFIGSHIVDRLLSAGTDTIVYARSPERFRPPLENVTQVLGDFTKGENLDAALDGVDTVIHSLTTVTIQDANTDMPYDIKSNLLSTIALLEKCVEHGVKRVVFMSSGGAVYGATDVYPTPETVFPKPVSSYGATKLAIEHYLSVFQSLYGLDYCALRIANPYGPRQDPRANQGVIGIFASKILSGEQINIFGDGSAERDYIYVKDCADAAVVAAESDAVNYVANIGSGTGKSLNEIIDCLESKVGKTANVTRTLARSTDVSRSVLDIQKFKDLTGWSPKSSFSDGIDEVLEWLRQTKI